MIPYKSPEYHGEAFNCPHCGAYSNQSWSGVYGYHLRDIGDFDVAFCTNCKEYSVWYKERMIHPSGGTAPLPNSDLLEDVKVDYEEARNIVSLSPRGAAALLRLALQKLCKHLGEKGKDLNTDIANLVKKGLPAKIQKALDIVRVIGNGAVHPGQIDIKDNAEIAQKLFELVNLIAETMITQPKLIDKLYENLPESQKEQIIKRDNLNT